VNRLDIESQRTIDFSPEPILDPSRSRDSSVVSINGAAASLAASEFMLAATGVRAPNRLLTYNGRTGKVTVSTDEPARRVSVIH
jgi:hypothetical protein